MDASDWVNLARALAWPAFALVAVVLLRKPLTALLAEASKRVTKLSVAGVAIEMAVAEPAEVQWTFKAGDVEVDARNLSATSIPVTGPPMLVSQLTNSVPADYAVIDLGSGKGWLTSRLFLFSIILEERRSVRCLVFLAKVRGIEKTFIGIAAPTAVRRRLRADSIWLEDAFAHALTSAEGQPRTLLFTADVGGERAESMAAEFVASYLLKLQASPPEEPFVTIDTKEGTQIHERAQWIDAATFHELMPTEYNSAFRGESLVVYDPDQPREEAVRNILRRSGEFVAQVTPNGQFLDLVDRRGLVEQVVRRTVDGR